MPLWNNNDLESSKPSWLNEEQKRQCFRTIRGWEVPVGGQGFTNSAVDVFGLTSNGTTGAPYWYRSGNYVGMSELLVAMPMDPSSIGVTSSNRAGIHNIESRGQTSNYGATSATDLPNYKPYITSPVAQVTGLTSTTVIYATKGVTSYIPVIASDANLTDIPVDLVLSLTTSDGSNGITGLGFITTVTAGTFETLYNIIEATAGTAVLTGTSLSTRQNIVYKQPTNVKGMTAAAAYWDPATATSYVVNRYGGIGGITAGASILRVGVAAITGNYALRLQVGDNRGGTFGATGYVDFTLTVTSGTSY